MGISDDHLSLPRTLKSGIESHSGPELNGTQNYCETKVSNRPTSYQISHVIVPDMVFPNNSHISDEISYISEENILNESNRDRKFNTVLIDADFSSDLFILYEILDEFEKSIPEESSSNTISNVICPHNGFISCDILDECDKCVRMSPI
ncbi:unnamed protein product [Schistosoma margrebowiei]|uniref:Uncharacterized protein n=1 Tax=Schistosoma margrebowiei TaxID=48269 RepID=A0A183MHW4_9TREM|nr:unnamed protein product [Schistosoma margrebowiei]